MNGLKKRIGVLLLNLGGPEKLDDVEPFLLNLFSDRDIIRLGPPFLQKFIARRIVRKRSPASRENYRKIGGGSPIREITGKQARALERLLGNGFMVRPAMRYWHPFTREVLAEMRQAGVDEIIALPLYPHYSIATTGSSLRDLRKTAGRDHPPPAIREIRSWPDQESYISCLAGRIEEGIRLFDDPAQVRIVYSAHSLPRKYIDEGDPYLDEIKTTIRALEERTGRSGELCFQSRSGPVQWLAPSTPDMLQHLAKEGCRNILMVPISFVSDHIETLYEIDMLYKDQAKDLGMRLESTRGLNDDPVFIRALEELVREKMRGPIPGSENDGS